MSKRLEHLDYQILSTQPLVAVGEAVGLHPSLRLASYADQISEKLAANPNTMLQYSPIQILHSMMEGRAVVVTDLETNKLLAFAQIWKYGETGAGKNIYEFGSWLSFKEKNEKNGEGQLALNAGMILGRLIDPEAQIIAIVESKNVKAQKIITGVGGIEIEGKFSPVLRTVEGEPAWMKRYDISLKEYDLDQLRPPIFYGPRVRLKRALVVHESGDLFGPVKVVGPTRIIDKQSGQSLEVRVFGKHSLENSSSWIPVNEIYQVAGGQTL